MKLKILLALSVLANVFLVFSRTEGNSVPSPKNKEQAAPQHVSAIEPPQEPHSPPAKTNAIERTFGWETVESPDYQKYVANLRSVGCPEQTIRDIILADVDQLFDRKKQERRSEKKEYEFWKSDVRIVGRHNPADLKFAMELEQEKNALLRALGIQPDSRNSVMASMMNPMDAMLDFLNSDKKARVHELVTEAQNRMIAATKDGQLDPAVRRHLESEMESSLASLLTSEEHLDYQLRFSPTANSMRHTLEAFNPSKEEFVEVFKLRHEFENTYARNRRSSPTPEEKSHWEEGRQRLRDDIEAALGKERYADYEMAMDPNFRRAHSAAKRSKLGVEEAKRAWQMRREAERQANELHANSSLQEAQRQAALKAIRQETESSIRDLYGENGWKNYARANGAAWLDAITR